MKGFKNVNIYIEGKGIVKGSVTLENGKIKSFEENDEALTLDENLIVVPGFIDKHIHGANNSVILHSQSTGMRFSRQQIVLSATFVCSKLVVGKEMLQASFVIWDLRT